MKATEESVAGQTVVVVGASSGIGAAVATTANRLGAHVVLASRSAHKLQQVRATLADPQRAEVIELDYLDATQVRERLGHLAQVHHLVIPAVADENKKRGRFVELSEATMRASFDKFWGQINVTQALAPKMPAGSSITLFSSVAAIKPPGPKAGLSVMNAVQAAVATLGQSLALELAPGRVNVMPPGVVLTNVWTDEQNAENRRWAESTLPARHAGTADDIAHAVLFLMTSRYVTGSLQVVDGGLSRV
jgi:NAD(P)-dependent dehydrogenase (short-subunit alcohol dehydrogenase family)